MYKIAGRQHDLAPRERGLSSIWGGPQSENGPLTRTIPNSLQHPDYFFALSFSAAIEPAEPVLSASLTLAQICLACSVFPVDE